MLPRASGTAAEVRSGQVRAGQEVKGREDDASTDAQDSVPRGQGDAPGPAAVAGLAAGPRQVAGIVDEFARGFGQVHLLRS